MNSMNRQNLYAELYNAVKQSYHKYLLFGDRSEEKLKPLHTWTGNTIKNFISDDFNVYFLNGKEVQTEGKYYTKIIDVAIVKKSINVIPRRVGFKTVFYIPEIEMAISIKFITSNFKQNANNYFEGLLGECANLRAKGMKFGHFIVFRDKTPYFKRSKKIEHWEILEDRDINKYIKLFLEREKFFHSPNVMGIEIINIDPIVEERYNRKPKFTEEEISRCVKMEKVIIRNGIHNTNFSDETKELILNNLNLEQFFTNIKKLLNE